MTLRGYCEQMGLGLEYRRANGGWACAVAGFLLHEERVPAEAVGHARSDARKALARLIAGHTLQCIARPTTLFWVPDSLDP